MDMDAGPLVIQAKPKWQLDAGPLRVLAMPEWTTVDFAKVFHLKLGPDGAIELLFGPEDFKVNLGPALTTINAKISGFIDEVQTAWDTAGWAGSGRLLKSKFWRWERPSGSLLTNWWA